jgi:hypothetical protein
VVGADHPERAGRLEDAAAGEQPGAGESVIGREVCEAVPIVINPVDARLVRAVEIACKLQVVRRVGEDKIDAAGGSFSKAAMQSPSRITSTREPPRLRSPSTERPYATPGTTAVSVTEQGEKRVQDVVKAG